jgi:hypothetical protein
LCQTEHDGVGGCEPQDHQDRVNRELKHRLQNDGQYYNTQDDAHSRFVDFPSACDDIDRVDARWCEDAIARLVRWIRDA